MPTRQQGGKTRAKAPARPVAPAPASEDAAAEPIRRPLQARSQETMDRFLDATEELLAVKSFAEISVTEIIEKAQRTVGSFYARFDDKDAVLRCLRERAEVRARERLQDLGDPARWADVPLRRLVREFFSMLLSTYREGGPVYRATAAHATLDEDFRAHRQSVYRAAAGLYVGLVLARSEEIGAKDPRRAADLGFQLMGGILDSGLLFGGLGLTEVRDAQLLDEMTFVALALLQPID